LSTAEPLPVRILEGHIPYRDGSEERILEVLTAASDRSSDSDELAAAITDWPSRYHLSRQRASLLRPLRLGPGLRILEIGAGTGVLSRYLAETGAQVVALEGSVERARAAAVRCAGLDNIEVVCGSLASYDDPLGFDLVCIVGVLEYSASGAGGSATHRDFLARAAELRRADGALLVAIENQIGVKYLLGYREDHLGLPWIGVEGYPGSHGIRTFTRRDLEAMLVAAGMPAQTWLYPFPDYKLPSVVLSDALYDLAEAPKLVDQLVRHPVRDDGTARTLLCDDRRAHRVMLEAGLGRDIANSFLVIAAAPGRVPSFLPDRTVLAWRLGDDRRRRWRRHLELRVADAGLTIRTPVSAAPVVPQREAWLSHDPTTESRYVMGQTTEELVLEACDQQDAGALTAALEAWRRFLDDRADTGSNGGSDPHPFRPSAGGPRLPPEYLDVALSNFVVEDDGLHFIDREWQARGGVARDLVMTRALWLFSQYVIRTGATHPWPDATTVDELATRLGELCGLDVRPQILERMRAAEVELQHIVTGVDPGRLAEDLEWISRQSRNSLEIYATLPATRARRDVLSVLQQLRDSEDRSRQRERELEAHKAELSSTRERLQGTLRELDYFREHFHGTLRELEVHKAELSSTRERLQGTLRELDHFREHFHGTLRELETHKAELVTARAEIEMWRRSKEAFERRLPVRLYHALRRLLGR